LDAKSAPTKHIFRDATTKQAKRPNMQWPRNDFKPIQGEFRLTAKAACDYTE